MCFSDFTREITEKALKWTKKVKKKKDEKNVSTSYWVRAAPKSWSKYTTIDLEIKGSKRAYCPPLILGSVSQVSTTRLSTLLDLWPFESGLVCIFRRVRASHIERTSRVIEPVFQRALEKIFAGINVRKVRLAKCSSTCATIKLALRSIPKNLLTRRRLFHKLKYIVKINKKFYKI